MRLMLVFIPRGLPYCLGLSSLCCTVCVWQVGRGESEILYPLVIIYFVKNHIVLKNSGYLISNPNMVSNEEKIVCKFGISSSRKNWWKAVEGRRSALLWEP